ncbi:MAG: DUF2796 domain-containing protein [Pusillimonas sp.]
MRYPLNSAATDTTPTLPVLRFVQRLRRALPAGVSGLALLLAATAHAQAPGKHVHGQAELDIAIEESSIALMLVSPLDNILGFEHTPHTDAERKQANNAQKALAQGDRLFAIDEGAGCTTEQVNAKAFYEDTSKESPHSAHAHNDAHRHAGDQEHAHPAEDTHNHGHSGHAGMHADAELTVQYRCTSGHDVKTIDTSALFDTFPRLQTLQVQLAGPGRQAGMTITRTQPRISVPR